MNDDAVVMTQPGFDAGVRTARTLLRGVWNNLETCALFQSSRDCMVGMPTHFCELDDIIGGLHKSELIVLAGRSGMGKSIFVQNVIRSVCRKEKARVALFSPESTAETVMRGIVAGETRFDARKIRNGRIGLFELEKLGRAASPVESFDLRIDDTPLPTLSELCGKMLHLKRKHDVNLVIIDYLQLIAADEPLGWNREREIAEIVRTIKKMARLMEVPVILVSQLSGKPEAGYDDRPVLSDLGGCGAIEQDADVVLLLHRPDYYNRDDRPGEADMIVAKHRNGPTGCATLAFIREQHRFKNFVPYNPEEAQK